ncbi:MAG TPA: methyltransferase domain-containing protein [Thermoanaerobaculia bacterium]|nr:methyltransferase domain-containing protein [Thermoanaerobaculia bacterium]
MAEQFSAAALYAAFAAALLALTHRWVVRLSWQAALVLALLPLCFTGPALLTGRVYAPIDLAYSGDPLAPYAPVYGIGGDRKGIFTDVYSAIIPWRQAVRYAVRHGEWPLLNPFILCGDPLAGSAQPAPYYPINALSLLLPLALAFTFGATAQLLVSALGAFLYFRDLECRESAAILGAVGWAFSSFLAFWLEWPLGAAVALLPLVVLGARRVVKRPGWPSALLLATALALTLLAGHPESAIHVIAVGAVLGLAEAAVVSPRRWLPIAGWAAAAGGLALALSAIYLLPLFEVLRQTIQWTLRSTSTTIAAAFPLRDAWRLFIAGAVASTTDVPEAGALSPLLSPLASAYVGSVLWGPALYGLFRSRWRGRYVLAALGLGGLCAGARMPLIYPLLGRLPLMSMAINERLIFAGAFATAALAALGVEAWLRAGEAESQTETRTLVRLCAAVVLAYTAVVLWLVPGALNAGFTAAEVGRWAAWGLVPPLAVALILGLLPRRALGWGAAALIAVLALQRTGEMGSFYPTLPVRAFYPRVAPLDGLPTPTENEEPWRAAGQDLQLIPNQGAFYEIEDVRGYQAIFHHRFADLEPLWAHPAGWFLGVRDVDRPFLSLMNVRYVIAARGHRLPGWRPVSRGPSSRVWENPHVVPRAFVPEIVRLGVPADEEVLEMKAEEDFRKRAWIAPPPDGAHGVQEPPHEERNGRGWVIAYRRGLGFALTARMKRAGWAVITETAWTGWRARIDGREVPLGIADHAFLALEIPEGWHHIELFYRPRSFELGLALSLAALGLIALITVVRAVRRNRDSTTEPAGRRLGDRIAIPGDYQHRALYAGPAPQRFWHRAKLEEALALLHLGPGDRMLDAGCGSGLLAAMAAEVPGTEVLGVDANPAAIEFVARTFVRPNLAFRQALVDELDAAPGSFEKIGFLEVIEHLSRAQGEAVLAQFARLLAPGGRLVLTTPNRRSPWPLIEWLLDHLHLVPPLSGEQHEVLYDLDELRAMGEAAGLTLAEHRMIDTIAPWLAWWPGLARAVHRGEMRMIRKHGCVMVLAFEKPVRSLAQPIRSGADEAAEPSRSL